MAAAAIIFFAFYGFDAIATAAEEAKNPDRDLAIGIVGSMVLCVIIYMAVAAAAIGALAYTRLRRQPRAAGADPARDRAGLGGKDPRRFGGDRAADGDPRLLLRAEPDLLHHGPRRAAADQPRPRVEAAARRCGSPSSRRSSSSIIAGMFPLADIAALANAGTLAAFIAVCAAMLTMRRREPDMRRASSRRRCRGWSASLGILGCAYLFWSLPVKTQTYFLIWNVVGLSSTWSTARRGPSGRARRA